MPEQPGEGAGTLHQGVATAAENTSLPSLPYILKAFMFESKKKTISTFFQACSFSPQILPQLEQLLNSAKCINRFYCPFLFTRDTDEGMCC